MTHHPPTRIHLDVDDVLADWTGAVCCMFGEDPANVREHWPTDVSDICKVLNISKSNMWRRIDAAGAGFWEHLDLFSWSFDLYRLCASLGPTTLLTSPSMHTSSHAGKYAWMQRHFGRNFRSYLIGPDKAAAASAHSVLVDDWQKNLDKYSARGGHVLLFPTAGNSLHDHKRSPLAYVEPQLRSLFAQNES